MKGNYFKDQVPIFLLALAFIASLAHLGLFDVMRLAKSWNILVFIGEMFPPDTSVLPIVTYAVAESVIMAFTGTIMGLGAALPLALLSCRRLFGPPVTYIARVVLSIIRTVPAILWALLFVIGFGFGPLAGVFGLATYTLGYLGKLFYEAFDSVGGDVLEAVKGVGASKIQIMRFTIIPESANYMLSQLLFMFEYNVRASSIVGLVGAGGIGFYIMSYIQSLQYNALLTSLIVLLVFVMVVDVVSSLIRGRFVSA